MSGALDRLPVALALAAGGGLVPAIALVAVGTRPVMLDGLPHFVSVSTTAGVALVASIAISRLAQRRNDGRAHLFATAFLVMALSLTLHGLASPGVLVGENRLVALSGALTVPMGAAILALSALGALRRLDAGRALVRLQRWLVGGLLAVGAIGLAVPEALPRAPRSGGVAATLLMLVSLLLFAVLAYRAARTFVLTRRPADLAAAIGVAWLGASLVGALTYTPWEAGWWLGHGFEVVGIAIVGSAIAHDLTRGAHSHALAGDLRASRLVAEAEDFLGPRVRAMLAHLAAKDVSTEAHTRRVADLAVAIGQRLGLGAGELRELAIGGLVHDVGKLAVPAAILRKPHRLTPEEYEIVKTHPERGQRLLHELGGFSPAVHRLVLTHHERLDGSGYPHGAAAGELTLAERILAVSDVYDALASTRVYRSAWTPEQALSFLEQRSGSEFDERCLGALRAIVLEGAPAHSPWKRLRPHPAEQRLAALSDVGESASAR